MAEKKEKEAKPKAKKEGPVTPRKVPCSKCGKECAVRPDILEKRIAKFGSLDKLMKSYECRKCREKVKKVSKKSKAE